MLKAGGAILKLVPGPNHLKELRHLAKDQLRKESYDNQDIVDHFKSYLRQVEQVLVSRTLPITEDHSQILADMTPLFPSRPVQAGFESIDGDNGGGLTFD